MPCAGLILTPAAEGTGTAAGVGGEDCTGAGFILIVGGLWTGAPDPDAVLSGAPTGRSQRCPARPWAGLVAGAEDCEPEGWGEST